MTNKKCITNYPRNKTDWKYINYLENYIKELKEENKELKEVRRNLIKLNTKLSNDLFLRDDKIIQLENKLHYYKQSLL